MKNFQILYKDYKPEIIFTIAFSAITLYKLISGDM